MGSDGTTRPEILLVAADPPQVLEALQGHFVVHELAAAADRDAFLAEVAGGVRALVTGTLVGADAGLIGALPNLEIIGVSGHHVDRIDFDAALARGIPVTNTPNISPPDVADLAIALIIGLARRIPEGDRFIRAGRWPDGMMPFGRRVSGKRLGIVGLGAIGRIVARRAAAFDIEVCYHGPRRKPDAPYTYYAEVVEMARDVDFLVVSCRAAPETYHLIDRPVLEALGPEGILVNVARGGIVDEAALVEALKRGLIAGAGLDVFEHEPDVPEALLAMENVILQAHVGAFTGEVKQAMAEHAVANLLAHFAGEPLPSRVA